MRVRAALCALLFTLPWAAHASRVGFVEERNGVLVADSWILVRTSAALEVRRADGSFSTATGRTELDRAIWRTGVHRIDGLGGAASTTQAMERRRRHGLDRTYRFSVPAGTDISHVVERFRALADVELAEPDYLGSGSGVNRPDDPNFSFQYGFDQFSDADVDGPEAWAFGTGSDEILIAVLDSGLDFTHVEFTGKALRGRDFANGDNDPADDHGHGTNVASIAAARTNNGVGVAGSCWDCSVLVVKVLDENNVGFYSWWTEGMIFAADLGAEVINMSLGGSSASSTLASGVQYAYDAGAVLVSITHNDDSGFVRYPGRYAETLAVGGTDENDERADPFCYSSASGSNYGPQTDFVAPGELIHGAALGGGYNSWCGTSQAGPLVSGLVGIMYTVHPGLGQEEVRHLIQSGADDQVGRPAEDTPGFDEYHGWGRVNMDRTLQGTVASTGLRVAGPQATRVYFEQPNPLADSYDFIRGSLGELSSAPGVIDLGHVVCLEDDSPDPDLAGNEDTAVPPLGTGFFYLSRFNAAPGAGSYGGSSSHRDRWASSGDCSAPSMQ